MNKDFNGVLRIPILTLFFGSDVIILLLYVYGIIITSRKVGEISQVKPKSCETFDMNDLGLLHYYLCVEVWKIDKDIFVSKKKVSQNFG